MTVTSGGNRRKFQLSNEPSTNNVRCLDQTILWAKCNGGIINSVDVQFVSTLINIVLGHHKCYSPNCDVTFYSLAFARLDSLLGEASLDHMRPTSPLII